MRVNLLESVSVESFVRHAFSDQKNRLAHVQVIADKVRSDAHRLNRLHPHLGINEDEAYRAGLLHDIGYFEPIVQTGFHPVDGASFLRREGSPRLAELIEGHSSSPEEATLRGFDPLPVSEDIIAKIITYWDMRVVQGGTIVTYAERIADILDRYGPDHILSKATLSAKPRIEALMEEIEALRSVSAALPHSI